jgi:transposase
MRGPKPQTLSLSEAERKELKLLVRRHSTPQQLALRGRIILAADAGKNNSQIAREEEVSVDTVRTWRKRWLAMQGIALSDLSISERLSDEARPGRPSQITAEQTCQMVALACEQPKARPNDFPPWSTVWSYFRTWRNDGTWKRIHTALREQTRVKQGREPTPSAAIIDSQSVKTSQKGGGAATTAAKK